MKIVKNKDIVAYTSDGGAVHTLTAHGPDFLIVPYTKVSSSIGLEMQQLLVKEFGERYFDDKALKEVCDNGSDMMYVMTTNTSPRKLIGCIAVNRKQFYPFVTDLCVVPDSRNKGHARALMTLVEEYVKTLGYTVIMLHCTENLVVVYEKLGFCVDHGHDQGEYCVMSKNLVYINQECNNSSQHSFCI